MPRKEAFAKNIEVIAHHDLHGKPGFQMAMQEVDGRYYLYLAHFRHPGWAIVDVTDPARPDYLRFVPGPEKAGQVTLKLQVAGGLMITALQQAFPFLHGTSWEDPYEEGVYIWDVKDPTEPRWLSHWETGGGFGVHRFFYDGGRYAHLAASRRGFKGFMYRILDVGDPAHPTEVGSWWAPEQWTAGYIEPKEPPKGDVLLNLLDGPNMHGPAYPKGDLAYLSYGGAGMVILDISDITLPRLVGQLRHHPPLAGKLSGARCHTVIPLSQRPYAVMSTEGERYPVFTEEIIGGVAQPLNIIGMVDVSDPSDPTLDLHLPLPGDTGGLAVQELHRDPGGRRRPVWPAQPT